MLCIYIVIIVDFKKKSTEILLCVFFNVSYMNNMTKSKFEPWIQIIVRGFVWILLVGVVYFIPVLLFSDFRSLVKNFMLMRVFGITSRQQPFVPPRQPPFIPSSRFNGAMDGYYFKLDTAGLGYYQDRKVLATEEKSDAATCV